MPTYFDVLEERYKRPVKISKVQSGGKIRFYCDDERISQKHFEDMKALQSEKASPEILSVKEQEEKDVEVEERQDSFCHIM